MKKLILAAIAGALFLSACNNKGNTSAAGTDSTAMYLKKITQVALASDSAFGKQDFAKATKDYAKGFVEYNNDPSKPVTNMDTIKAGNVSFFSSFPDFKGEKLHATAADSTVVVVGEWSGTFKKPYMKIQPTNKSYKVWDADIYTFNKAGQITSHQSIQSEATFLQQLGVVMPEKK
jgi:hypothetical protein